MGNLNDCEPVALFVDKEFQGLIESNRDAIPSVKTFYNLKPEEGGFLALIH